MIVPFPRAVRGPEPEEATMLWTIFVILLVLWLLGVVTSYTLGGFIHVLLIVAVVIAILQLLQGRRAL
jgi:asparagine N-glycosylation enzyme membrane subunit Stt3